jgi:hypothetical protein
MRLPESSLSEAARRRVLAEAHRRWASLRRMAPAKLELAHLLHPKQLAFAVDPARFKVARTSRRAGKTVGCCAMLVDSAQQKPGSFSLYITKTRLRAKQLIWRPLLALNTQLALGGIPNEAELSLRMPNGSFIYLAGANTRDEIEKRRGDPLGIVILDEAQSLPAYIKELADDILGPGLMDYSGSLVLTGTPPPVPAGYFNDCCESTGWRLHEWTAWENPYLLAKSGKTIRQLLDEELARRGVTEEEPSIQREWFGRNCLDLNSLVFRYEAAKNDFTALPTNVGQWSHVIGVDLGFDDADAIAVLSWSEHQQRIYLTHESVISKQTITQLGDRLKKLEAELQPLAIVIDTGGLGRKIEEELQQRWGLGVEAAEKSRKNEHIELLNDDLRSGRMFAPSASRFAQDCMLVEWDKSNPESWSISDRFHSDICDAVLYAHRKALHWLSEAPKPPEPGYGTPEHARMAQEWQRSIAQGRIDMAQQQENDHRERLEAQVRERNQEREQDWLERHGLDDLWP